jgi:Outer membrane protein and related peptidoglycan-associated (lipo)proteins
MKKLLFLVLVIIPAFGFSQNILNKVKNKVKQKAEQRVDSKIDKTIDKGLDKVEGAGKPGNSKTDTKKETTSETNANAESAVTEQTTASPEPALKSNSRFDFVPGDSIVYTENFESEAIGELPTGWNTSGNGEVVTLNKYPGKWLRLFQNTSYLTANESDFGENFTVEFDVIMQLQWRDHFYPYFTVSLVSSNGESTTSNDFIDRTRRHSAVETTIYPAEKNYSKIVTHSYLKGSTYLNGDTKNIGHIEQHYGKPIHIAIQVQKERYRMWINQEKVCDFPKGVGKGYILNQVKFEIHSSSYKDDQVGYYISNLKIAKGIPDTRHKLIEEGKFSTTGILFDVNSDVIKPESYGVLKDIAKVLKENEDVKIKVVGHTDSDGNDAANLTLSQKRAAAVIKALNEEFGIDASRMQSDGKGETQPVADNKTKEGKAANRRVEFIKL